jgi:hypothetical protein
MHHRPPLRLCDFARNYLEVVSQSFTEKKMSFTKGFERTLWSFQYILPARASLCGLCADAEALAQALREI